MSRFTIKQNQWANKTNGFYLSKIIDINKIKTLKN